MHGKTRTVNDDHLLDKAAAARYLGVSIKTLDDWIYRRRGPRYVKLGGKLVRYRIEDLLAYVDSCPTGGGLHVIPLPANGVSGVIA